MVTQGQIEKFRNDAVALGLKFPVSAISEATGEAKGNVSKYLNNKMQPSESFLNRFYNKFGKVVQSPTTRTETPQNGAKSLPQHSPTLIGEAVKTIQYKTNPSLTIEEIAEKIKYSRVRLTNLTKQGHSDKVLKRLQSVFARELEPQTNDKLTTATKSPQFDVKPTNGTPSDKDTVIKNLSDAQLEQAAALKNQSESILTLVRLLAIK